MNDIPTRILISEIRHCIAMINKDKDITGGVQRLGQLADNIQAASEKCGTPTKNAQWKELALRLYNVRDLRKTELRKITVCRAIENAITYDTTTK